MPYVAWCVNTTRMPLLDADAPRAKELEQAGKAMLDPYGDGRWIRQACASAQAPLPGDQRPEPLPGDPAPRAARPVPRPPAPTRPTRAAPHTPRRYTPGRKEAQLSEARLRELNAELERRLVRDAEASLA